MNLWSIILKPVCNSRNVENGRYGLRDCEQLHDFVKVNDLLQLDGDQQTNRKMSTREIWGPFEDCPVDIFFGPV